MRIAGALASVLLLTSCAGGMDALEQDLRRSAQEQVMKTLAGQYTRALGQGIGTVVNGLAAPGGYLDNPLVRILLPPPVMLALDLARELRADTGADMLDVLVNSAAEQAIPGAGPILQAAIAEITPGDARALLDAGRTAGTDYLKARTTEALRETLQPLVATALAANGARQLYGELLEPQRASLPSAETPPEAVPEIAPEIAPDQAPRAELPDLEAHVTEQAIEGLFKVLTEEEARIREEIDSMGLLKH
jgi:hypothetical protein